MGQRKKYRKLKRRVQALEAQAEHTPAEIPTVTLDLHSEWRATAADYAGYIDDDPGDTWRPCGYA